MTRIAAPYQPAPSAGPTCCRRCPRQHPLHHAVGSPMTDPWTASPHWMIKKTRGRMVVHEAGLDSAERPAPALMPSASRPAPGSTTARPVLPSQLVGTRLCDADHVLLGCFGLNLSGTRSRHELCTALHRAGYPGALAHHLVRTSPLLIDVPPPRRRGSATEFDGAPSRAARPQARGLGADRTARRIDPNALAAGRFGGPTGEGGGRPNAVDRGRRRPRRTGVTRARRGVVVPRLGRLDLLPDRSAHLQQAGYPWDRAGVACTVASPGPVMSTAFCSSLAWWSRHVIWPCWSPPGRGVPDIRV